MNVSTKSIERRNLLPISDSLQLMIAFGGFTLTLITTIIAILNYKDKKHIKISYVSRDIGLYNYFFYS